MKSNKNGLGRGEKILLFLLESSREGRSKVRYEDIVVGLFKKYPQDFQLKGYPEYPDSGDLIHKPLYNFKKKGYVNADTKVFSLTERGVEMAEGLANGGLTDKGSSIRLSRSGETEISRIRGLEGFKLFSDGKEDKLSDSDFYNYLGVTVRTSRNAFMGRMETMSSAVEEFAKNNNSKEASRIAQYHSFLNERFSEIVQFFQKS